MHILVLIFWLSAYLSTVPRKKYLLKRIKIAAICVIVFFLLVELTRDIVFGVATLAFREFAAVQIITQIIIALIIIPSAIIMLVFGTKLTKELGKFKDLSKTRRRLINRVSIKQILISMYLHLNGRSTTLPSRSVARC
jgi:chromate transport protein ChrA